MTTATQRTYYFQVEGEKPLPLLKERMEYLKQHEPTNPLLSAKGYELISIPEGTTDIHQFIQTFLAHKAESNKVYVAIVKLGATKTEYQDIQEMTGKCNVKDNIVKGARVWVTKHVVYKAEHTKGPDGGYNYHEDDSPVTRNIELGLFDTKGEAMAFAKQYAIDHDTEVFVELEKRLDGSVNRVADISPIKKNIRRAHVTSTNRFLFMGKE